MDRLSDHFGSVYLINLPERVDRLNSAKRQLASVGLVIGPGGIQLLRALRFADRAGFPNAGSRGCFQSHLECLRRARSDGLQSVLILEDDIALSPSLPRLTSAAATRLGVSDWDFVYFGHYGTGDIPSARRDTGDSELRFTEYKGEIVSTHFYGVSGRILPRLIAHLNNLANGRMGDREAGPMPLDGAYNIFRRNNPDVRCLIVHPKLGWQTSSASDITPGLVDRLTFLRPVNTVLRDLKQLVVRWRS